MICTQPQSPEKRFNQPIEAKVCEYNECEELLMLLVFSYHGNILAKMMAVSHCVTKSTCTSCNLCQDENYILKANMHSVGNGMIQNLESNQHDPRK